MAPHILNLSTRWHTLQLTPWSIALEKLPVTQLLKKFLPFVEPAVSREPATGLYPE